MKLYSENKNYKLYDVLCYELSFEKVITLYKLLKHKMETLEDEPVNYLERQV